MKKENQNKRAEMTITQTLTTILLILAFALLLFIFYRIFTTVSVDKEACHESVVFRATAAYLSPEAAEGTVKASFPLKCRTNKICFTSGFIGGSCEEFKGEKGITTIKVKDINQLQKAYAEEMISCWSMMGEGKIDLFSGLTNVIGLTKISSSCVICSRIAFDKVNLEKAGIKLEDIDLERYMVTHFISGKNETYYSYLAGEKGKISINNNIVVPDEQGNNVNLISSSETSEITKDESQLVKSDAILFMQVTSPGYASSAKAIGGILFSGTVGSVAIAPVATVKGFSSLGKLCGSNLVAGAICAGLLAIAGVTQQGMVAYNRNIAAGYCGDVSVGENARNGCSVVRTVIYNAEEISQYCGNIEGLP
jgi:hypothetical protein